MAYVDHAFSISDEDDLVGGAVGGPRGAPIKEIAFAVALLAFGALGAVGGLFMAANRVGGDRAHDLSCIGHWLRYVAPYAGACFHLPELLPAFLGTGIFFMILGIVMFIPGFYYSRIAYYAYKGYKGFSFSNIPPI
ncbi:hypothetical protein BAE44_0001504 [Dichanthelium oligosanthes]|uniref:Transmembrane protein 230 n=1 Tax=Dichanthelium oligosanthes TaxID=888268 RepID=A0A1E5WJC7_9POAL|nr:hypothetical protein BAE44_0001504 [Dichanthelium oligosanthes]